MELYVSQTQKQLYLNFQDCLTLISVIKKICNIFPPPLPASPIYLQELWLGLYNRQ